MPVYPGALRFARDSARTGRTQRPRTVVECICDLSQIDVLMQETHGNQTLPKVTGTGDVPDPYPSLWGFTCCLVAELMSPSLPSCQSQHEHRIQRRNNPRHEGARRRPITTMQPIESSTRHFRSCESATRGSMRLTPQRVLTRQATFPSEASSSGLRFAVKTVATLSSCSFMEGRAT